MRLRSDCLLIVMATARHRSRAKENTLRFSSMRQQVPSQTIHLPQAATYPSLSECFSKLQSQCFFRKHWCVSQLLESFFKLTPDVVLAIIVHYVGIDGIASKGWIKHSLYDHVRI